MPGKTAHRGIKGIIISVSLEDEALYFRQKIYPTAFIRSAG